MTPVRVVYLCWPNGRSLHNVGRALVRPMAARGITVDVVDSRAWFARPTPADAVLLAHLSFYWPGFPYRRWVREVLGVIHDPDEVSTFGDRLSWRREPMHEVPTLAALDRVLTCSREMVDVLRTRYGLAPWHAATFPHNGDAVRRAARATTRGATRGPACGRTDGPARDGTYDWAPDATHATHAIPAVPVRFLTSAFGPERASWREVLARVRAPRFWTRDERGAPSLRQLRSAVIRQHRKNTPWLRRLAGALAADPRAAVDFRYGTAPALDEAAYLARLTAGDVYVCTSCMEGGPLPVMEAVLAGLAVVSTPVGQVADWVRDGESGFLCTRYADVERACRRYLDDPALLRAHQRRARALAAERTFDADGWEAFLRGRALAPAVHRAGA